MQEANDIIDCYDKTAENYAEKFINELDNLKQTLLTTEERKSVEDQIAGGF